MNRANSVIGLAPFGGLQIFAFWVPVLLFASFAFANGAPWSELWSSSAKIDSLWRTLWIATQVTAISAVLSYVYVAALLIASPRWRAILLLCVIVPFLTSIIVRTYAWTIVLGPSGPVNGILRELFGSQGTIDFIYNRSGVLIGMVHVLLPMFLLPLYAVAARIPTNLGRAARTMGADRVSAWFSVDFRLGLPGAAAGAALVFIQSLGFFVTPAMLGGLGDTMIAQFIERDMRISVDLGAAAALSIILVAAVAATILIFRLFYPLESLFVQSHSDTSSRGTEKPRQLRLPYAVSDFVERWWLALCRKLAYLPWVIFVRVGGILIAMFFLLPLLVVLPVSFTAEEFLQFPPGTYDGRWYPRVLSDPEWLLAIGNTVLVGVMAVCAALTVAVPFAFVVVRSQLPESVRGALVGVVLIPAIVPIIVLSVGMYVWFLETKLIANLPALSLAHAVLGLPFAVLILIAALRDFDIRLEHAARSLGAGKVKTLCLVTLPVLLAPLVTGALLTFLVSFDELLIARAVTNYNTATLPVKLWTGANEDISPALAVISVVSMAITLVGAFSVLALAHWSRKQMDRQEAK